MRLPYYDGGRYLQFIQARNAIRGWIRAALPLGSGDDVGQSYLHCMVETTKRRIEEIEYLLTRE